MSNFNYIRWLGMSLVLALASPGYAQVHRCKDASGKLSFSDRPCDSGQSGALSHFWGRDHQSEPLGGRLNFLLHGAVAVRTHLGVCADSCAQADARHGPSRQRAVHLADGLQAVRL